MKRFFILSLLFIGLIISAPMASAQSLSDILRGIGGSSSTSSSTGTGDLGGLITGVASALGLGNSSATIENLAGTWNYAGPAVSFKSENFLLKAGGAAAATTVEQKLEPYYKTAGLTSLVITINADSTFTFKGKRATLNGTIEYDSEAKAYVFHFKALKKINIGSMEAYIQLTGNQMQLTFDVTKLMTLVQRISLLSGNTTLKGLSAILEQYDGMTAGFDMTRTAQQKK